MNRIWLLVLAALLVSACILPDAYLSFQTKTDLQSPNFYFGVSFGGKTTSEAKLLIDRVKSYTNLFVINSWDISGAENSSALDEICDYAVNAGMRIIVYFSYVPWNYSVQIMQRFNISSWADYGLTLWQIPWLNSTRERWGNKFLGVYLYDEPGGKQIDRGYWIEYMGKYPTPLGNMTTYSQVAAWYTRSLSLMPSLQFITNTTIPGAINSRPVFTADYALYWFDYLAGYDGVFAELGWDHNRVEHVALCRGAANVQNKQWGAIITWAYYDPPYLASGKEMLQDMIAAYRAGAKYLIVFNYPQINPYGALTEEHFTAMETFWNQIHSFPGNVMGKLEGEVALVLPKDYGWGMRHPDDKIWGLWPADDLITLVGTRIATLINEYGLKLDIIYDDPQFNYTEKYSKIYYWNSSAPLYLSSVPIIAPTNELYATLVTVAIAIIGLPSYVIMKRKKRRKPEAVLAGSGSKASLTNFGRWKLELVDNTIRFYTESGYFRKRKKIVREIPVTDVESVKRVGSEFSVTWKGVTDVFVVEETDLVRTINERTSETLEEQRRTLQDKEAAKQERNELVKIISVAIEITDSLFDILRSLHGQVDWNRVESYTRRSEETGRNFMSQEMGAIDLDFTKLLLAVKAHTPEETAKETYRLLRALYEYFRGLASKNEFLDEIHPNCHDAKTTILAYYTLNDVILGTIVGDEETGRESKELLTMLNDLSKGTDLEINVDAFKGVINKLHVEKGKESAVEETRMVFRQQLKAIITDHGAA
jgi:hypothetical protein